MAPAGLKREVGQKCWRQQKITNILSLYKHYKKPDILNWNIFLLQTTYLHESLEGLNSSLAQSDGELLPGEKSPPELFLREQNFGQFLVYEP